MFEFEAVTSPFTFVKKSARYPALYASALAARRQFRVPMTIPEASTFAKEFRWKGGRLRAVQAQDEIVWLLEMIRDLAPRRVLEIGTANGGTLFLWTRVAAPNAYLVSVDMCPLGLLGRHSAFALLCRGFARDRQRIDLVFGKDSHDERTRDDVQLLFGNQRVDFLFIDGDHSYEGVTRDFKLYSSLVRPGGLVAFHDVAPRVPAGTGVPQFWAELKTAHDTMERVAPVEPSYGIGGLARSRLIQRPNGSTGLAAAVDRSSTRRWPVDSSLDVSIWKSRNVFSPRAI
jgi:predicted O-methyltransferase YrrM